MKKIKSVMALAASFVFLALFSSCALGLDPAKSAFGTTVSIHLSSLASAVSDRAIIQGSGFLYIQTGSTTADAKLYGPWQVGSGSTFSTDEIPAGSYDFFSIIYLDSAATMSDGPVTVDAECPKLDQALGSRLCADSSSSYQCLSNVRIAANRENSITALLKPATTVSSCFVSGTLTSVSLGSGGPVRLFHQLYDVPVISGGNVLVSLPITLTAAGSPVDVSRIALYDMEGKLLGASSGSQTLASGASYTWTLPSPLSVSSCYLYVESDGSVSISSSLLASNYAASGRSVWYASESGDSDGSDSAHPCTFAQAVACSNNSTASGTRSVVLTGNISLSSSGTTVTKNTKISSLGDTPYAVTYSGPADSYGSLLTVNSAAGLEISNCTLDGGSASTPSTSLGYLVNVTSGSLSLQSGATLRNISSVCDGCAVAVGPGQTFSMNSGSAISNCSTTYNAAVYLNAGSMTMNGGTISACTAQAKAGGVYVAGTSASFTMKGGLIDGCTAPTSSVGLGGAAYISGGSMTMSGGTITNCSAYTGGGGVAIMDSGSMTMDGGSIESCKTTSISTGTGGGIFNGNGSLTLKAGKIATCSSNYGGGVYSYQNSVSFAANTASVLTFTGNAASTSPNGNNFYKDTGTSVSVGGSGVASYPAFLTATGYGSWSATTSASPGMCDLFWY